MFLLGQSPRAAEDLLRRVEDVSTLLVNFPSIGRARPALGRGLRSFRVRQFQYVLFYRVEGSEVRLIRLLHGARRIRRALLVE
jgi:toxin ParE1/3/4